jgi:hypothetical protein
MIKTSDFLVDMFRLLEVILGLKWNVMDCSVPYGTDMTLHDVCLLRCVAYLLVNFMENIQRILWDSSGVFIDICSFGVYLVFRCLWL